VDLLDLPLNFIAIDFETTGLTPDAEIIEIGMVKVINGEIKDRYNNLIRPQNPIPQEITSLTGITNEMVSDKKTWPEIVEEVLNFIGEDLLVAHNVDFDKGFLERGLGYILPNLWVDTWDLAKITIPSLPSYQLAFLADFLKVKKLVHHRAVTDAEMTAELFIKLIKSFSRFSPFVMEKILSLLGNEGQGLNFLIKNIYKKNVANYWAATNEDNTLNDGKIKYKSNISYSFQDAETFFAQDGILSENFTDYEFRPQQLKMLKVIQKAFINNYHAVIEAATGTGKSLAYLIPAILWAQEQQCKIMITTNTITLQEQLYQVDIPFLERCFKCKLPVSIVKGRNNYLCLRRFHKIIKENQYLSWREKIFLAQIYSWLEQTKTGDKEEINLNSYENELWLQISSQMETCIGSKCSYSQQCYYLKNRREADKSNIIITNHSLLLQDIKRDNKILPQHDYLIIDEAHNLEGESLKQFAQEINLKYLKKIISQLIKSKNNGLLQQVLNYLKAQGLESKNADLLALISEIKNDGNSIELNCDECIKTLQNNKWSFLSELRITEEERKTDWWQNLSLLVKNIANNLTAIIHKLNNLINQMEIIEEMEDRVREIRLLANILIDNYLIIEKFLSGDDEEKVYWLQITADNLVLIITPLNIAKILEEKLFSPKKSVILTSATLVINNSFNHVLEVYGLNKDKTLTLIADSPFDYSRQSMICIPTDLPEPLGITDDEYAKYVTETLIKLIPKINGGILILFTSYQMLNAVYFALKKEESLINKEILAHGKDGSRKTLIETLKNKPYQVVVLGTNSFWEGIDIQGLGLTAVIIVKLPFNPPTRPVIAARLELLEKNKQNSFYKYSLPLAVLRFRQGYGRLIRSKKDWGVLIILDKRVVTKKYGINFIKSLPEQRIITAPTNNITNELANWMENKFREYK